MPDENSQKAAPAPDYLTVEETAAMLRTPRSQLDQWRHFRKGPPYVKLRKRVLYPRADLLKWLDRRRVDPEPI